MEKLIKEIGFVKEEDYQKIKKILSKKDDYLYSNELYNFNAVLMQRHEYS